MFPASPLQISTAFTSTVLTTDALIRVLLEQIGRDKKQLQNFGVEAYWVAVKN
jgi:hypothetical protein